MQEGVAYLTQQDISARGGHFFISEHMGERGMETNMGNFSSDLLMFSLFVVLIFFNKLYKKSNLLHAVAKDPYLI